MNNKIFIVIVSVFFFVFVFLILLKGQNDTRKLKESNSIKQIQKSIDQTHQLLSGSKEYKNQLLKQLDVLQSQIYYRKELQQNIKVEIQSIESQIQLLKVQNEENVVQLKIKQIEYVQLLKNKLIHRLTYNPILALLHPDDMDVNIKRWYLADRLENQRKQTFENLQKIKSTYHITLQKLESESYSHDSLLKVTLQEEKNIEADINKSNGLIKDLSSKESELNKVLLAYKKQKDDLTKLIESSIQNLTKSKEFKKLSKSGLKIRYPIQNPTIVSRFGNNMERGKSKLLIRNNGIDLQSTHPFVRVSINSEVVEIRKMPNQLYLLITKSDNLFVVYSNLENVLLKNGEQVEQGVNLGKASKNEEGFYELHFETWLDKTPINPLLFLN